MLRGHHANDDLRVVERAVEVAGRGNRFWQNEAREKVFVDSASGDAFGNFRLVRPEANLVSDFVPNFVPDLVPETVSPFASEDDGQRGAPRAGSDDGYAAHGRDAPSVADLVAPNLFSVPAERRLMLWRCFQITSTETAAIKSNCRTSTYSRSAHTSRGKAAAATTDPSET